MSGSRVQPVGEVVARLRAAGLRLPTSSGDAQELVVEAVESGEWLWALGPDFEVVSLALVMGGRVLTHRLSPREVAAGILDVGADFPGYALQHLAASGLTAATGAALGLFDDLVGPLDGPLGFDLPAGSYDDLGVGVGDLVGITFEAGVARLVAVAGVGDPTAVVGDLATLLAGVGPVSIDEPFDDLLLASKRISGSRWPQSPNSSPRPGSPWRGT